MRTRMRTQLGFGPDPMRCASDTDRCMPHLPTLAAPGAPLAMLDIRFSSSTAAFCLSLAAGSGVLPLCWYLTKVWLTIKGNTMVASLQWREKWQRSEATDEKLGFRK